MGSTTQEQAVVLGTADPSPTPAEPGTQPPSTPRPSVVGLTNHRRRHPDRKVRGREAPRAGRHGRRVSGVRSRARARGRAQGDAARGGGGPGAQAALRARGPRRRALEPPRRRDRLRPRVPHRRLALHRDGAAAGARPLRAAQAGADALARREDVDRRPGARRPRPRAQGGDRPPRHQAGERVPDRGRLGADHGLRHRVLDLHGCDEPDRARHGRLHVARAGPRRARGRPQRSLQRRHAALRAGDRAASVRR